MNQRAVSRGRREKIKQTSPLLLDTSMQSRQRWWEAPDLRRPERTTLYPRVQQRALTAVTGQQEQGQRILFKKSGKSVIVLEAFHQKLLNFWASPVVQRLSTHIPLGRPRVRGFGSRVRTWHCLASHAVVGVPHIKWREMGTDVSSGPGFLSKKRRIGNRC